MITDDNVYEGLEDFSAELTTTDSSVNIFEPDATAQITDNDGKTFSYSHVLICITFSILWSVRNQNTVQPNRLLCDGKWIYGASDSENRNFRRASNCYTHYTDRNCNQLVDRLMYQLGTVTNVHSPPQAQILIRS